ncbi:Septal ring factor EnvC, activator of murein hydrolases AmiA and AmiB [Formivibrio citricus]|uniref:Septal ring factor EnvC, activator of murein hydrolases AmiA and AmiB n=1 Tax=Formivibrio citricus TaxID=83765 RepID=A0A1I5D1X1_9NEIS|nr:peptidoglycan DD-metalloendopeptidase family protein [Formivibrio citricus]SFN93133.1 Septal ring factor EnvC, activator of murein hydrolases AmiA and AmiB [Formivibrio citricus]
MNIQRHFTALILASTCAFTVQAAPAVSQEARSAKQAELSQLRSQLGQLKKDLAANESQKAEAADALKDSEKAISEANRVLTNLSEQRELTAAELAALEKDIARARIGIRKSQERLSQLLKNRYKAGQLEAWRLLLNQQDPNRVSRELTYYRHLSQAQLNLARTLERQLEELNRLAQEIRQRNDALKRIAHEKQQAKAQLEEGKKEKAQQVAKLSKKINAQRNQIQKLAEDEKRMTALVERLNALIRKQEAERVRLAAKKKAERERLARQEAARAAKNGTKPSPKPATTVNDDLPDESQSGKQFTALKGKLRLPLRGEIIGRFGAARSEGATWKGLFIRSASGQAVKAVASGRVVFADWMRGFGNLIILDHGGGYLTIYAANESLLKQVGDPIKAGDTIATSGNSGGMSDSGVYFELRQNGKPLDPMAWVGG